MCGRFTLKTPPDQWGQLLLPHLELGSNVADWSPRYNIAPTQSIVAVVRGDSREPGLTEHFVRRFRWGLVPFWADDLSIGNRMINARSETLAEKPAFRNSLAKRRCAILADGYYEWQTSGKKKQPYWIHRDDNQVFAMLGLWDSNTKASQSEVLSATIITSTASDELAPLHDRMPVILSGEKLESWLDPTISPAEALQLFENRQRNLHAIPVSSLVNNPRHEDPACLNPVGLN